MFNYPQNSWKPFFDDCTAHGVFDPIVKFLNSEFSAHKEVYPSLDRVFRAYELSDLKDIKVVILGQDPYHGKGEANGLCFSVYPDVQRPPSLRNIFLELHREYPDFDIHRSNELDDWADQGVFLLNSVLTVRKDQPGSHSNIGWEKFTDASIQYLSEKMRGLVFILLGKYAAAKGTHIDISKHYVLKTSHPSPLSSYRGFLGSGVFSQCNKILVQNSTKPIRW